MKNTERHSSTLRMAMDRALAEGVGFAQDVIMALDRGSVRTYDQDGRMHISMAHISKANVCPYKGSEIPRSEELGLKPNKIYTLLRDPDELAKAAPTSNHIQLLIKHKPVSPSAPSKELVVGSTGTDGHWDDPYVDNSLVVWDADAIQGIESSTQKELSAGYYYTADMTPGIYEGVAYDGVMRNIRFNHVALVVEGRAGSDVAVGDSMENLTMKRKTLLSREAQMAKGAIAVILQPRLAQDAKLDLNGALASVTSKNWDKSKVGVVDYLKALPLKTFRDKLAMDAGIEDVLKLLDSLEAGDPEGGPDDDVNNDADPDANLEGTTDPNGTGMDSPEEAIRGLLQGKVDDSVLEQVLKLLNPASDEDPDAHQDGATAQQATDADNPSADPGNSIGKGAPINAPAKPATASPKTPDAGKAAMDAKTIQKIEENAVRKTTERLRAVAEAQAAVKPLIGEVPAMDSAEEVYRLALDHFDIDVKDVPPAAYKAMVAMIKPENVKTRENNKRVSMAQDGKTVTSFRERFPEAGKVRVL